MSILLELKNNEELVKKLSKPLEEAVFTVALLRKTDCADISTLDNRIICQKVIYLANCLNIAPRYEFNLYIHGPYSPDLAKDLFGLSEFFNRIPPADFVSKSAEESFVKLSRIVSALCKNARDLELASTLAFFKNVTNDIGAARKNTMELKRASAEELGRIERYLNEAGLL